MRRRVAALLAALFVTSVACLPNSDDGPTVIQSDTIAEDVTEPEGLPIRFLRENPAPDLLFDPLPIGVNRVLGEANDPLLCPGRFTLVPVGSQFQVSCNSSPETIVTCPGRFTIQPDGEGGFSIWCWDTPTTTTTTTTTTTPGTTTTTTSTTTSTTTTVPGGYAMPDASNTGPPADTSLTTYSGPCTITTNGTTLDERDITCATLTIEASNVTISNSESGPIYLDETDDQYDNLTISYVKVDAGTATGGFATGIYGHEITVEFTEVIGGNRSMYCDRDCTVTSSWFHSQSIADTPRIHASGLRQNTDLDARGNRISCDAQDTSSGGGCSAAITGYGDWNTIERNTFINNWIGPTYGGYCAYGGSTGGKPFPNGNNINFTDNIFYRDGSFPNCGVWGPITDFDNSEPTNTWSNNVWSDNGDPVTP